MLLAERYEILECLHDGPACTVHRARAREGGDRVVLKVVKSGAALARLRHELDIQKSLDLPGVVCARELVEQDGEVALVRDDLGGEVLAARLARGPLPLGDALRWAAELADTLGHIHQRRVIHKDINPSNLLLCDDGHVRVFDFDIATRLPREVQSMSTPNLLAGTLLYISPEQTGRMNRSIDHRTDLYSFGATLYAMLTGRPPFLSDDPLELVHFHIAKIPIPPAEVDPAIPKVVSDIVMKLLEKTAEARYQSAFGLKADLEESARRLEEGGGVEPFSLGQKDASDRFYIPQKLYGREAEVAALSAAFARLREGNPELFLVTGASGIGKSSVTLELYRSLSQTRGYFVSGKFEELKRDIPYHALLGALSELIRGVLAAPDAELAVFRQRIKGAVRDAGRVLTDVLPDLIHIIGPQPPAPEVGGAEARSRFRFLLESFVQVFTRHGEPLVVFLDDLQWADAATLDLLPALLGDPRAGALLVIGAYRDNEVFAGHPLISTIAEIEREGYRVRQMTLGPLGVEQMNQLIEDTLALSAEEARPLAELVFRRTGGNPLFAGELLSMLHKSGLIEFDPQSLRWTFDIAQIERAPSTGNVAELMAARAAALEPRTRQILELGAILGVRFDLDTLAIVAQRSPDEAAAALEEALGEGLVLAIAQEPPPVYRFLHDRVQEAVYTAIAADAKLEHHRRVGRLLLARRPERDQDDWLFEVLHHMNLAAERVRDPDERLSLARLNHAAARRAAASGSFAIAAGYCAAGIGFLPEGATTSHHELWFALALDRAYDEYLSGDHTTAEELFEHLREAARTDLERAQIYDLMARYREHRIDVQKATALALKGIDLLGAPLNPDPTAAHVMLELLLTRRAFHGKSEEELLRLPMSKADPRLQTVDRLQEIASRTAFFTKPKLWAIILLRVVRTSLGQGISSRAAVAYNGYGVLLARLGDYARAEAFGRLGLAFMERCPNTFLETGLKVSYGAMIHPWRRPAREALRYLEEAEQCGLMSGNQVFVRYAVHNSLQLLALTGCPLEELRQRCEQGLSLLRKIKLDSTNLILPSYRQMVLALSGLTRGPGSFDTADFDEAAEVARIIAADPKQIGYYWVCKVMVLYLLDRHEEALSISELAGKDPDKLLGVNTLIVDHHYYDALLRTSLATDKPPLARQRALLPVRRYLRKLEKWARNAPMNFRHKHMLVAAELARVTKDDHAAIGQYEEAIKLARNSGFMHDEAIALELAGKFYRSRGLPDVAVIYLARAREAYARWGALAKVALLDQAYPGLAARAAGEARPGAPSAVGSTTSAPSALDVPSMIKASQALSGVIALDKLLLRLMSIVAENAGAERGALVLPRDGARLVMAEFTAQGGAWLPERPAQVAEHEGLAAGIVSYVFRTQKSVVLRDAAHEGDFTADPVIVRRGARAVLCAPLLQQGEVKGVVYLENNLIAGAFTAERAELLSVLCAQMAISIDNALLYADLEQKVKERTRTLRETQARLIQLEKEATESQMAGGFAHEMRNALASAQSLLAKVYRSPGAGPGEEWSVCRDNSDRLKELFLGVRDEVSEGTLDDIAEIIGEMNNGEELVDTALRGVAQSVERGLGITGLILQYAEVSQARPGREVVAARPLVEQVLHELEGELDALGIQVIEDIPEGCALTGNPLHFHAILKNLLTNARDALQGAEGERVIRVGIAEEPERQVLSVSDTGAGIARELHERIFEPFFTTKLRTGTGLGLGLARKLASLYGGSIELESEPLCGATFRVIFPRERSIDA